MRRGPIGRVFGSLSHRQQREGAPILDFISDLNLQCLLPRGTITYTTKSASSTIDLILGTEKLKEGLISCEVSESNHGSDHEAIDTKFEIEFRETVSQPRRLWKSAPWSKICNEISTKLETINANAVQDLELYTSQLMSIVENALDNHVPIAHPSLYAKNWWTEDLSFLRVTYTKLRNNLRQKRRDREVNLA